MGLDSLQLKCAFTPKICKYNVFGPKFVKTTFFAKKCKYYVFCPEIRKNALIDSFLRIAAVIDSSASSAGLLGGVEANPG